LLLCQRGWLSGRVNRCQRHGVGGLFLFVPVLARARFDQIMQSAGLPGSRMVPAGAAMRSLLALKLTGAARTSHGMASVFDQGLALFAGLNVIPKRSFLTEYSCRIASASYPKLMSAWFDAIGALGLERGVGLHLDFHTIPFHGEDALVEKHYVSKRSRRQKGVLAFLAQDAERRVFCYANAGVRKADQADEVLRFAEFWEQRTGRLPRELVFDSKLTTYANLEAAPVSAWRRIELKGVHRAYRTPKILDRHITLTDYTGPIRQIAVADLGHEEPTLLLTNQLRRGAAGLVETYAKRMLIENSISDGVDFFHMDALSSVVAMKVNCDLRSRSWARASTASSAPRSGVRTRPPNHVTSGATSSTPQPGSPSPTTPSSRGVLRKARPQPLTCSTPASPKPTSPYHGGEGADSG
jgi:hypothetical protein